MRYAWMLFALIVLIMILAGGNIISKYGAAVKYKQEKEMSSLG